MRKETVESYVLAIHSLGDEERNVTTSQVADVMGNSPSAVSEAFVKLAAEGYIQWIPYRGAKLTEEGRRVARKAAVRFDTLYRFLRSIGVEEQQAMRDAGRMELQASDQMLGRIRMCLALEEDKPPPGKRIPPLIP